MDGFPASISIQRQMQPIYETCPGWNQDTTKVRKFRDLPPNAQHYVNRLMKLLGIKITLISVGTEREQIIRYQS